MASLSTFKVGEQHDTCLFCFFLFFCFFFQIWWGSSCLAPSIARIPHLVFIEAQQQQQMLVVYFFEKERPKQKNAIFRSWAREICAFVHTSAFFLWALVYFKSVALIVAVVAEAVVLVLVVIRFPLRVDFSNVMDLVSLNSRLEADQSDRVLFCIWVFSGLLFNRLSLSHTRSAFSSGFFWSVLTVLD